ncbi:hypothetical protein HPP92_003161 [Vanilla planifolia]|uniref:Pentatricopeptide repeat-containing protein n=1 Tax=Vanilla planifolia TaxID=51239 RepID=A0A835S2R0_VANPL|nr:hypothetical protein HPP92_003161 [Vanilla planifolia]
MKSFSIKLFLVPRRASSLPSTATSFTSQCRPTSHLFDEIPHLDHDPCRFNALLSYHVRAGEPAFALQLFQQMRSLGVPLDSYTFPPVLSACSTSQASGRQVHALMLKFGCISSPITATSLLDMYSSNSPINDVLSVFDEMLEKDTVAWNALLSSLITHGLAADAFAAFRSMVSSRVYFNGFTLCSLLKACVALRALNKGRQIHAWVIVTAYDSLVMATALVALYSSVGQVEAAMEVFNGLESPKDLAIFNALANACVKNGRFNDFFELLVKVKPLDERMLTSAITACSESFNLAYGKQTHCIILRYGLQLDTILCNALINMYSKCGDLHSAHLVFTRIENKNVASWTSIIDSYGSHGRGNEALTLFQRMEEEEVSCSVLPNAVTFLSVLSACSHSGMVNEAKECFFLMKDKYAIDPGPEHYACLIDLLGRAGKVEEAWDLFCSLYESRNGLTSSVCVAMLNACTVGMDFAKGDEVAKHLLKLGTPNSSNYVQVSNFYGAFGRWQGVEELRTGLSRRGLKKQFGTSHVAV